MFQKFNSISANHSQIGLHCLVTGIFGSQVSYDSKILTTRLSVGSFRFTRNMEGLFLCLLSIVLSSASSTSIQLSALHRTSSTSAAMTNKLERFDFRGGVTGCATLALTDHKDGGSGSNSVTVGFELLGGVCRSLMMRLMFMRMLRRVRPRARKRITRDLLALQVRRSSL